MRTTGNPANAQQLAALLKTGEGPTLEFKRSTGELKEGLQTLCAFLNSKGGTVLFGVNRKGGAEGQQVSEQTVHDITAAFGRFEPPVNVQVGHIKVRADREVMALHADAHHESVPFAFEGRAYERAGNTTRKMSQERYEKLLLQRGHAKRRWENLPAEGLTLKDLDRKEILRTRELAIQQNRISPDTSRDIGDILDRLGLRVNGVLTQAAHVLYGTAFLSDAPQCLLKMGRFRGTEITGRIVDNRQEHLHAFAMVREGMAFLERTMPLGARFPKGTVFREDRFPVPLEALREILLNAVMHRDYSYYGGHVAIVVFDDRIEIRSYGRLPSGVTVEQLSGPHLSELRNPLIAEAFHRTGAVEVWGRGTNRVIESCKKHGAPPPIFEERQGFVIVTFKARLVAEGAAGGSRATLERQVGAKSAPSRRQITGQVAGQVTGQVAGQVLHFCQTPRKASEIQESLGLRHRENFQNNYLKPFLEKGWLERTIPNKPRSRLQRYRTTAAGLAVLKAQGRKT